MTKVRVRTGQAIRPSYFDLRPLTHLVTPSPPHPAHPLTAIHRRRPIAPRATPASSALAAADDLAVLVTKRSRRTDELVDQVFSDLAVGDDLRLSTDRWTMR